MPYLNKVILVGNLTRDPEMKQLPDKSLCKFSLAMNRNFKDAAGEKKQETTYVDVTVWGKQAEACKNYLSKGSCVMVEGSLKQDSWTTEAGEKRSKHEVNATQVQFMSTKPSGDGSSNPPPEPDIPF